MRMLDSVALQSTEVVGIPDFRVEVLENAEISPLAFLSDRGFEMLPKIHHYSIVVEERIVDIEQKHYLISRHTVYPRFLWFACGFYTPQRPRRRGSLQNRPTLCDSQPPIGANDSCPSILSPTPSTLAFQPRHSLR